MEISFKTKKLAQTLSSSREMQKVYGQAMAKKIQMRMSELQAAETLEDVSKLPPARCHALINNREGQFAVILQEPYRLVFQPDHEPIPKTTDGGIDLSRVTVILILEVVNYHD